MYLRSLVIALIAGFTSSFVYAIGIGEISLQSSLGDPLHAKIDLMLEKGDSLEDKCLSLVEAEDSGGYLPTGLTAKLDASGRNIEIRSRKPFDELFAIFRLQIKCSGMGSISKTFTVLPEVHAAPPPLAPVAPVRSNTLTPPPNENPADTARSSERHAALVENPAAPQKLETARESANTEKLPIVKSSASVRPVKRSAKRLRVAQNPRNVQFRLKLSGGQLDTSRIGMITPEQHESLLAQQLLLDEDDQTAHFLSMQHQLKLLQEELGAIKLKLATLESPASAVVNTPGVVAQATLAPLPNDQNDKQWSRIKMVLGLFIATLITWLGFRYFGRTNYQTSKGLFSEDDSPVIRKRPVSKPIAAAKIPVEPAIKPTEMVKAGLPEKQPEKQPEKLAEKHSERQAEKQPEKKPDAPEVAVKDDVADSEEYSILEEAEFYAVYGHPDKGVKILKEYVARHPQSEKPWMWMLSIFSSRKQVAEFEATARAFLLHNENSAVWKKIQVLGRAVDKNNTLYVDENPLEASAPKPALNEALFTYPASEEAALKQDGMPTSPQNESMPKDSNSQRNSSVEEPFTPRKVEVDEEDSELQPEKKAEDKSRPLDFN